MISRWDRAMNKDAEINDLAKMLIETFGTSAPKHALQLAASLKVANRDRAMRYELAAEISKQMIGASASAQSLDMADRA
jgi:hypothetical protein